jgi:hypothetical protein
MRDVERRRHLSTVPLDETAAVDGPSCLVVPTAFRLFLTSRRDAVLEREPHLREALDG